MDQQKTGALRREKGVTQEQLAERLCVSNRTVSRWENGNNLPDFAVLIELAAYHDVTVDEILRGERAAAPQPRRRRTRCIASRPTRRGSERPSPGGCTAC